MATTTLQQPALPPGPRPLPFVGNILEFRRDQLGYLQRLQQTYGNMATIYIGKIPIVLLFRPEHVRYVLTENPRNFTSREVAEGLRQLIGDGLITIDGETHREQRRRVQPAFHKKRVESYAQTMVQFTEEMLEKWQAWYAHDTDTNNFGGRHNEVGPSFTRKRRRDAIRCAHRTPGMPGRVARTIQQFAAVT